MILRTLRFFSEKIYFFIIRILLNSNFTKLIFFTALLFLLFSPLDDALARIGGGGGYGGGRSSGGGSFGGGGSGSGGDGLFFLIYLAIRYPAIGIPALIIFGVFSFFGAKKGRSAHMGRVIRKTYSGQNRNEIENTENSIKKHDENFSSSAMSQRVAKVFPILQNAWADQKINKVRHLLSDGIYEKFKTQLEIQQASQIKNSISDINIKNISTASLKSDRFFDTVTLKITASAVDFFIENKSGKKVYGSKSAETFTEFWSFLRRPGVKTIEGNALMEGFCPNCGTPLKMSDSTECPSCRALVNSGEYDWVLAEITQESEWKYRPDTEIKGLKELISKDPSFNIQHIEDKASVMFYRYIASGFFADKKYLAKLASENFLQKNKEDFSPLGDNVHSFYADAAVGSVELLEALHDESENYDKLRVKIRWSGHKEEKRIPSLIIPDFEKSRIYTHEFILIRKSDLKSSDKNVLSSAHCPGCGAPETKSYAGNCEYCGIPLNDGSRSWVLNEKRNFSGYPETQSSQIGLVKNLSVSSPFAVPGRGLSEFDTESMMKCMVGIMLSDGQIDTDEMELLEKVADSRGIDSRKLKMLISTVSEKGELDIPVPSKPEDSREYLRAMIQMCLADGKVTHSEKNMLRQLSSKMHYSDFDINQMIKKEKLKMYKNAKLLKKNQL